MTSPPQNVPSSPIPSPSYTTRRDSDKGSSQSVLGGAGRDVRVMVRDGQSSRSGEVFHRELRGQIGRMEVVRANLRLERQG